MGIRNKRVVVCKVDLFHLKNIFSSFKIGVFFVFILFAFLTTKYMCQQYKFYFSSDAASRLQLNCTPGKINNISTNYYYYMSYKHSICTNRQYESVLFPHYSDYIQSFDIIHKFYGSFRSLILFIEIIKYIIPVVIAYASSGI